MLIQYDNLNSISFKQSLLADNVDHQIIANDPAATTPPRKKLKKRRPREATKKNNAIKGSKLPQNPLKSIENNREKSDLEMTLPITNSFVGNDSPLSTRIFKDLFSCASVGLGGLSPSKTNHNYSSPTINSRSSISTVSSYSFSPLALHFNQHASLILSRSPLISCFNPKGKQNSEDPFKIDDESSGLFDKTTDLNFSNLSNSSNQNFWNTVEPNFQFIMGQDLIKQCQEADLFLADNNLVKNSTSSSYNEFLEFYNKLLDLLNEYAENLQNGLLLSSNEIHNTWQIKRTELRDRVGMLQKRHPNLKEEVTAKLNQIDHKWSLLEKILIQRDSYNKIPNLKDLKDEISDMDTRIREAENKLIPYYNLRLVNSTDDLTIIEMYHELQTYYHLRLVPDNNKITNLVFRCLKYNEFLFEQPLTPLNPDSLEQDNSIKPHDSNSFYPFSSHRPNIQNGDTYDYDLLNAAKNLENRWNKIRLAFIEVFISIEGTYSQLNLTSTNSPTSFNTTWDKNKSTTDDENIFIPSSKTIKITRNFVSNHKTHPPPFLIHSKSTPSNLGGVLQNPIYNFRLYSSINSTNHQRQVAADIENPPYLTLHDTPLTSEEDDEINEVEEDTIPFLPEEYEKIIDAAQPPPNASMKNTCKVSNDEKEYRLTARIISPARKGVGSRTYGMNKDTANIDFAASPSSDDSSHIVTTTSTTTVTKNIQISKLVSHIFPYEPAVPFYQQDPENLIHDYWKKDRESFYTAFHDEGRTPFSRHKRWDIPAPPTPQNEKSFISNDDETSQGNTRVSCSTGKYLYDRRPPLNTTGYEKRYSCPRFKNGYYNSYSMDIKPLYHQHFPPPRYAGGHPPFSRNPPIDAYGKRIEYEDTTVIRENRVEEESRQMRMPPNVPKTEKGPICRPICQRSGNVTGRNRFLKSKFLSLSDDCLYASLPQKLTSHLLFHGYREPISGTSDDKPLKYLDEASYPSSPIRSNTTDILLDAFKKRAIEREILAHHMGQRIKLPDSFGSANQSLLGESDDPYKSLSFGSSNNNDKWYDPALLTTINKHVSLANRSIISNKIVSSCPKYISTPSNWVDSHNYLLSVSGDLTSSPNPKSKVVTSTKKPLKAYNNNNLKTTSFDFSTTSGDEEPSPRRQLYNKKLNNRLKMKYLTFKTKGGAENNVKKHDLKVNREDFKAILSATTTDDNNSTNEESMWDPYQAPLYATDEEADHILQSLLLQYNNDCPSGVGDVKFESAVEEQSNDKYSTADDNTCSSKEGHDELGAGNVGMNSLSLRQFEDRKPLFYYGIDNSRGSHTILFDTPRDCITTRSIHNFCQKIKKNKSKRSSSNSDSACYVVFDSDSDIEDLKSILVVSKKDLSRAIDAFCKFRSSSLKPPPKSLTKVLSTRDSLINYIDAVGAGPFNQRMYDLSTLVNICRTHIYFLKTVIENIYPDILDENEDTFNARTNGISFDSSLDYIDNKEEDIHHHQSSNSGIRGLHIQDKNKIFLLHDKWQQLLYNLKTYVPEIKYLSFFKSYLIDPESSDSLEQFEQFSISHLQNGNKLAWLTQNAKGLKTQKKGFPFSADNTNSDFLDGINLGHPISTTNPENLTNESSKTHHRTLGKFNDPYDITEITSLLHSSNELIDNLSKKITNLRYRQSYPGKSKNMLLAKHPQAELAPKTRSIISKINMFSTPIGNRRFWKYFTYIVLLMFLLATYLYLNMPSCCDNRNNFKRSLNFVLNYPYGPPPK